MNVPNTINSSQMLYPVPNNGGRPMVQPSVDNRLPDEMAFGVGGEVLDVQFINSPSAYNNGRHWGLVCAPNGFLYSFAFSTSPLNILKINPNTNTASLITGQQTLTTRYAVLGIDGNIYSIPHAAATAVMRINTSNDTVSTFGSIGSTATGKFAGGVLAPNGNIYCIPGFTNVGIGVINTTAQTITTFGASSFATTTSQKYTNGILAPNGLIYCPPFSTDQVLVINPSDNTFFFINNVSRYIDVSSTTITKFTTSFLGFDNKIYSLPWNGTRILVIDPETNSIDSYPILSNLTGLGRVPLDGLQNWNSQLATNGKVYSTLGFESNLNYMRPREYDYINRKSGILPTETQFTFTNSAAQIPFIGTALAPNGNIYFTAYGSNRIMYITGFPSASPEMYTIPSNLSQLPTSLYNKFSNNK